MRQTRERIFHGKTRTQGKILSLFEPATEVIRNAELRYGTSGGGRATPA
jgi:hypothetical protein